MPDFTKKAIRNSFIKLLNEKPLKQITVKDIVDDCCVNRNTFYYHFRDIPTLLETIIKEEADNIVAEYPTVTSIENCIDAVIDFSLKNRKAVLHIYQSVNRDIFEQYQWNVCDYVITTYIDGIIKGRNISESDRKIIINYMECVCFGIVIHWLDRGMKVDIKTEFSRIYE